MRRHWFIALSLALALALSCASPRPTAAAEWIDAIDDAVRELQIRRACFGGSQPTTLHILGVVSRDILDEATQIELLTNLNARLSASTGLRVTRADTFRTIATSSAAFGGERQEELRDLLARSDQADITLVLRPFRATRGWIDVEVVLWARNAGGEREITCTPSLAVSLSRGDPQCAAQFRAALEAGTVDMLRAFRQFRPDCPQAEEVDARIAELRAREAEIACQADFNEAVRENSVAAFDAFIGAHPECALRASAQTLRDQLATQERQRQECDNAYNIARSANTVPAYEQFASRYAACPEADLADALATALREQKREEKEEEASERPGSAPPPPDTVVEEGPVAEPPRGPQVVYRSSRTWHLGDENIRNWSALNGRCLNFSIEYDGPIQRLTFTYDLYGAEATSIAVGSLARRFDTQSPQAGRRRPNYWSNGRRFVMEVGGRLAGEVPVSLCSRPVRDAEFAGDQDDFMIRNIRVVAE